MKERDPLATKETNKEKQFRYLRLASLFSNIAIALGLFLLIGILLYRAGLL